MRGQWTLIVGIIIAIVIATFAVINVDPVEVNYLFGQNEWPLVLVILGSVLMGGIIVGSVGIYKIYRLQMEIKSLKEKMPHTQSNLDKNKKTDKKDEKQVEVKPYTKQKK
ncbi:LapA family protein [Evansella cellulosilytica]|uniref:Lipopolysaccharide assembly protein A domain-containing protein n=1 Tax=Evansella cellulosilytica (strain ATCC 21833 / DSM 2522 / FERM P-1141 / JCM 9156 / N-4) TaxID=649639 RepID=E6TV84_EVAC2|nr:lipopolysaccharide assembly protein LapA domain-containing protein [Evansella cellulosilytica]ADU29768.1 hypothetical protein Bcell_1505 [Evansella cellulosilytica DSM 2522]